MGARSLPISFVILLLTQQRNVDIFHDKIYCYFIAKLLNKFDWEFNMNWLRTVPFKQKKFESKRPSKSVATVTFVRCVCTKIGDCIRKGGAEPSLAAAEKALRCSRAKSTPRACGVDRREQYNRRAAHLDESARAKRQNLL